MSPKSAIAGLLRLVCSAALWLALVTSGHAETLARYELGPARISLDLPDRLVAAPRLDKVIALSGPAPVSRLLVPQTPADRWRFSMSVSALLGYGPYQVGYARIRGDQTEPLAELGGEGGGSVLTSYQAPGGFAVAVRIAANGTLHLSFDHRERPGLRPGSGLIRNRDAEQPAPVPLPPAFVAMIGALLPFGLLSRRRRGRQG